MIGAILCALRGLRRGSRLELALAGFWLGLCFNVYSPSRLIPVMMILLAALLWLRRPGWRPALRSAWPALLGGALVGLAPLLLWAAQDPAAAYQAYFGKLNLGFIGGEEVKQAQGLLAKFDVTFRHILPGLPKLLQLFSTQGTLRPWFFSSGMPIIDQATLFLLLCGMAVSLVRARTPAYSFLLAWWLLGLTPTLLALPQFHMDERRIMLNMPATLLLAAVGLHGLFRLALRGRRHAHADRAMALGALVLFAALGWRSWRAYFTDIELDLPRRAYSHANFDNDLRAVFRENKKGPVHLISTRKCLIDNWQAPGALNELDEHMAVLQPIPYKVTAMSRDYLLQGGLFGLLRALPPPKDGAKAPDPLILLAPFHFYMEPFLLNALGGERVAELPLVQTPAGPDLADVGMARDPKAVTRLIRLRSFDPGRLSALEARWSYPFTLQELSPPPGLGGRASAFNSFVHDPKGIALMEDYARDPRRWRPGATVEFRLPGEPWFWIRTWELPTVKPPYRLSLAWTLQVPEDGLYRFGVSATPFTTVRVDGRVVASIMPRRREDYAAAREGVWGESVALKAGPHRFDVDAFLPSDSGYFNQLLRVLWQPPGGERATLPPEQLLPR
jgi:hypothetical protein